MNTIIFHGSAPHATADKFWYKNIAHSLNSLGTTTIVADLPKLDQESLSDTRIAIIHLSERLDVDNKTNRSPNH